MLDKITTEKELRTKLKWTVIDGNVYDITNYIDMHPGGKKQVMRGVGKDASIMFHKLH